MNKPEKRSPNPGTTKPYPSLRFRHMCKLAEQVYELRAGQSLKRDELFSMLNHGNPDKVNSQIRNMIKYGLLDSSPDAESFELSDRAKTMLNGQSSPARQMQLKFDMAVSRIAVFKMLYDCYVDQQVPDISTVAEQLREMDRTVNRASLGIVETFIDNVKYLGLFKVVGKTERLVSIGQHITDLSLASNSQSVVSPGTLTINSNRAGFRAVDESDNVGFYLAPVNAHNDEVSKHAHAVLHSIIEPALKGLDLKVAVSSGVSGSEGITGDFIKKIIQSKIVVADLSFHSPHVFYALALRHAARLPVIQLIRKTDNLFFNFDQSSTIAIETSDIYTMMANIESYRDQVLASARKAIHDAESIGNPISQVFPNMKFKVEL
ncbi:hypothetical protein WBG78_27295 [Chryseolinea sp. T2]|uniref:hypothetical protein n=1 Tax=Chryseolinea sp. T2 TaxID=3129255 RepID=UPI0030785424